MEQVLVSNYSIRANLRKTAKKGLISLLSPRQLNDLALKYFGVYENGKLVGYQCPYSGKVLTNAKKIVLEHIIPVSRGGGTVLFNCIPTSEEVNKGSEKGTEHLISWWTNSKYWDKDAPERLEKIIQYMLEAYEHFLDGPNEDNYDEDMIDNDIYDTSDDLESDLSTTQEEQQRNKKNTIITYYQFIDDALNILKKYMNVDRYQSQLQNLINKDTFKEIERATLIQNILKKIIKDKLEIEDRSELTYVSYFNIIKLTESINGYSDDDIYKELENRIDNIDKILNENNLSLLSFLTDKNSLHYLYRKLKELTNDDINQLIQNINICVTDKFNAMIEYTSKYEGLLPSMTSKDEKTKQLGKFRSRIQTIKNTGLFSIHLTKEQLEYLHNSEYETLREIYKVILNKAIDNNIEIAYIDEQMKNRILEFKERSKLTSSLDEQIKLEQEYLDCVVIKNQFNQFIDYVSQHEGLLPSMTSKDKKTKQLGNFRNGVTYFDKKRETFNATLTKEQLEYLHNSEYETLREIYKVILNKAIDNNIEIAYIDEQMKNRILEFKERSKLTSSLDEQIKLEQEYLDCVVIKKQFNQFIDYVSQHEGLLPSRKSSNTYITQLGDFKNNIINVVKNSDRFSTHLTKEQLEYLHDSEYETLREIYKVILNKAIDNNIEIAYIDEQMKNKILEFKERSKLISSLDEQIKLEQEYLDCVVIKNQFNQFIDYVFQHEGLLPSIISKDEKTKQLGRFRSNIQSIRTDFRFFHSTLTKEQLEYLHNSEYETLREIYKVILNKAIDNNIEIAYIDEQMKNKILEFKERSKLTSSLEEKIELERQYSNYIVIKSQFIQFIDYVKKNGNVPIKKCKDEQVNQLREYKYAIQRIKKNNQFKNLLTKDQLEYLHNSEYESLRTIYYNIIEKARQINYLPYLEVDKELESNKKGRAA